MRKRWIGAIGVSALAGIGLVSLVEAGPFSGMDVDAMRVVASRVLSKTQELQAIEADLKAQVVTAQQGWQGPDAVQFIASLNEQVTRLHSVQANLGSLAQVVTQSIHAQEGATGSGAAAAPRPRVRVLMKPPGE